MIDCSVLWHVRHEAECRPPRLTFRPRTTAWAAGWHSTETRKINLAPYLKLNYCAMVKMNFEYGGTRQARQSIRLHELQI